ncbi:MAG: hypothetical protein IJE46_06745 [Clostridia bacterium]|nr:hypothetical protein [Clostridia bacterium]
MADVKKCDRCGAIYQDKAEDSCIICVTHANGHERYDDLCPHCGRKYWDFYLGTRLKNEEWDNGKVY